MSQLTGKLGIVFGVANKRSIAWAIAQAWHKAGARLAFTYQGERLKEMWRNSPALLDRTPCSCLAMLPGTRTSPGCLLR